MHPEELKKTLCTTFCGGISVQPVPTGYAISSAFEDSLGDPISFYLTHADEDNYIIEDDGGYLAHLIAKDITIDQGTRGQLLDAILSSGNAHWDRDTYEIRTDAFSSEDIAHRVIEFLSNMIRVRDLELLTRDVVRSTFREDATRALVGTLGKAANIFEDEPISKEFRDFPADLLIKPRPEFEKRARTGAVYFVNSNDKLNEALLLQMEQRQLDRMDFEVIALVEDPEMRTIKRKNFQRAQNRELAMPIFRDDEQGAMNYIRRRLGYPQNVAA
ncbi:DUF1828 domain-containing protein [Methylobacterium dankookense]|uniref:DUF1828 domain-containing protein n=1 Tax=Methylobacterium dankookense TaxID=560405 RepID=A0A564FW46_9HYPH|nr:DUF1828 domain-containing protein [Methylobacterium dankookense]GJD57739.1 hypothetical protein IFDJLNFL_3651 [Methylobacterium dankookense]VUF12369.1 hypothetical protein MTDSW087_02059 [Methylobacterium dankookense]